MNDADFRAARWCSAAGLVCLVVLSGCGDSSISSLSGKVTHDGKPVTGGTLIFSPVGGAHPGKAAKAVVQPDGTYVAGTNTDKDGVKIGKVKVSYAPALKEYPEEKLLEGFVPPPAPFAGLVPKIEEFEVTSGTNTHDIELVAKQQK